LNRRQIVFISFIAAMTVGSAVLLIFDTPQPYQGGHEYSLTSYTRLASVRNALSRNPSVTKTDWEYIEIFYSRTSAGDLGTVAMFNNSAAEKDANLHFVICNGDKNGAIQTSERWKNQYRCLQGDSWYGSRKTIRVCIIGHPIRALPSDTQIKRTEDLVETLCKEYGIPKANVSYPQGWN
jgi:hypothetical protein